MAKKKKPRSQAPVALVYFLTLLLALSLAGGVSYYLLKKYEIFKPQTNDSDKDSTRSVGILFARVNDQGDFQDLCVIRINPFNKEITIVPQSDLTKCADGLNYREAFNNGGVSLLKNKVAENLGGIPIEYYATVTNSSFEQIADFMGAMSYTAQQELYYISQESSKDDISLQRGDLVTLTGRQIVNLASLDLFNNKKQGNLEFLSQAIEQVINNGFRQASVTKDNLYNLYEIMITSSDTNITKDVFNELRRYLEQMLDERVIPAKSLLPQGTWNDDYTAFTMSNDYKTLVTEVFGIKKEVSADITTQPTEPPAPQEPEAENVVADPTQNAQTTAEAQAAKE